MSKKTCNILFVDDDKACHEVISLILLTSPWYKVIHAYSGSEALEIIKQFSQKSHKLGLILLDVTLNDINGYEVYCTIRNYKEFLDTPIVLQTGLTISLLDLRKALNVEKINIIYKPYTSKALLGIINKLCVS